MMTLLVPRRSRPSVAPATSGLRSIDDLLGDFWRGFGLEPFAPAFEPRIDACERDGKIVVTAEVPGLEASDLDVSLDDCVLTLRGEKRSEKADEGAGYRHVERRSGSFCRRLRLPCEIDADAVKASTRHGVLTVVLPLRAEQTAGAREVPVTSS
jgi:HSP20 family protein